MRPYYTKKKRFPLRPVNITSAVSIFIFAMIYGLIEHMLLASPLGISVLTYPMNIHLAGQLYLYHVIMLIMAILVSFNPFFDRLIFRTSRNIRLQGLLWGTGNILNFVWLEDMFYWVLFGEWPKDVMTPLHISFYGIVWWYPVAFGGALFLYYLTSRIIRKMPVVPEQLDT
ncbi:MAG: hypothetical protein QXX64_00300 [Nitrososphaera sp.]|uniref:Uncharacterized protein n=1 Tax=Nitrososphaera gargensis (strain Ga9.2) TaxID=1237085 RepID=K0IP42_NITGG|nr:hypothetical protein [Candidatus Nitrososphaera gargensis]AFU60469.1 hypothetical protein Ngar_c35560 [Candidatus Nitrososphaera gargensis Ga9.2]